MRNLVRWGVNSLLSALTVLAFFGAFPGILPVGIRVEIVEHVQSTSFAPSLTPDFAGVSWSDRRLGTLRLDSTALASGPCKGWVCETAIDVVDDASPALLLLIASADEEYTTMCTGSLMGDRRTVLTAAHCLSDGVRSIEVRPTGSNEPAVHAIGYRLHRDWEPARRTGFQHGDVAIVVLDEPLLTPPVVRIGAAVTGSLEIWGLQRGDAGTRAHRCRPSFDDVRAYRYTGSGKAVSVPCGLVPGASGGPVFSRDGDEYTLVGVIVSVTENGTNLLAAVGDIDGKIHTDEYGPYHVVTRSP